jgi:hypothetical protein
MRADILEEQISLFKKYDDEGTDDVELDWLLDPYDGYPSQTYIQNKLEDNQIIMWEGWSNLCWDGAYAKPEYKGKSKKYILNDFKNNRIYDIAKSANLKVIDFNYFFHKIESYDVDYKNGYIMKITFELL